MWPWQAGKRYELTLQFRNPANMTGSATSQPLGFWAAPVSYEWREDEQQSVQYAVRGDKRGQICVPKVREGFCTTRSRRAWGNRHGRSI